MARTDFPRVSLVILTLFGMAGIAAAAAPDRITRPVDASRTRVVPGNLRRLAEPQFDQGAVDPGMRMDYMMLLVKHSPAQQAELDRLLEDQQNPSSPLFHRWLTPEEFGNRFGLSSSDLSQVVAWLASEGFTVNETGRGRNWIAFSGTAGQVSKSLRTSVHRFQIGAEKHFAITDEPSVPEALADVVAGFLGLDDFRVRSFAQLVPPYYNSGSSHLLAPEDFATIYDIAPLYQAGIDGTGQAIAVVGDSDVLISDMRAFRTRYNLPANDPKMVLVGSDPGYNGDQLEANLDLEWAGAVAPKATIYYVYGTNAITAISNAVNLNVAPVISISYGSCEIQWAPTYWRSIAQQGNAQGITILSASGDSGGAGCDRQGIEPFATRGRMVDFPAVVPEITGVGGTQFVEGSGTYWASTNSPNLGSALSYIPEAAWNESGAVGLLSSGGGASLFYDRPAWQTGPGVPADNARHVPDISLSAAGHDAYLVSYQGSNVGVYGTSASAPSMAGIVALLNHYLVSNGFQSQPGLGNINPQLYRLAQSVPTAFHDITSGDNIVPCAQASPDCATGSIGYPAGPGYDMATGLGSVDANILVTKWNTKTNGVTVTLSANAAKTSINDTIDLIAAVAPASGAGTPTGTVEFSSNGVPFGSVPLQTGGSQQTAKLSVPLFLIGSIGTVTLAAQYSGDAAFGSGGATLRVQITLPTTGAAILVSSPNTVWPSLPDGQGLSWQTTLFLRELAGVAATITGFTIDGKDQPLAQYFPSPSILPSSTVSTTLVFRNLAAPVTRTFGFTGVDATGQTWSRQAAVNYFPLPLSQNSNVTATPLVVAQNPAADPSCQWPVQVNIDELGGYRSTVTGLAAGSVSLTSQIPGLLGTPRLDAWSSLQGTICFAGVTPPASSTVQVTVSGVAQRLTISFAGAPAVSAKLSASPAGVSLAAADSSQPAKATLAVNLSDATQPWTAAIFPGNRTTAWLSASKLSGTGPGQIVLTASGAGFAPGAYRATVVIQSPNATPQYINVPVILVLGGSTSGTSIGGVANSATAQTTGSPGMLLSVYGTKLANSVRSASGIPLPYSIDGVSAVVNGVAAPLVYISQNQINLQVPYEVGAGPAVLGINNNGQIAGFAFQVAPTTPGIFADPNGNLVPSATVKQGGTTTLYMTGAGEVSPLILTGTTASSTTPLSSLPRPQLPLAVTVGGTPAFLQYAGISPGLVGTVQVNFTVPASVPPGVQPLVVIVGGVPSPAVNLTVQPASSQ